MHPSVLLISLAGFCAVAPLLAAGPALAEVHYGPHGRQVPDFFKADSKSPTPVLIFFHGGGYHRGKPEPEGAQIEFLRKAFE